MNFSHDPRSLTPADLVKAYINNAADLLDAGDQLLPGDRIELFCKLAANRPEVAFPAFMTILRDIADPTYRALALRGLRWIEHPETLQEIRTCETVTAQELVQMLASELLGQGQFSTDLTRWAASDAIINLQYPPSILRGAAFGGLMEGPDRIQREITEFWLSKKERLQRFSSQSRLTVEYERFLEFWTFGPVDYLFAERSLDSNDIDLLLNQLSWLGLEIAFQAEAAATNAACDRFVKYCLQYSSHKNKDRFRLELARFFANQFSESELVEAITIVTKIITKQGLLNIFSDQQVDVTEVENLEILVEEVEASISNHRSLRIYLSQAIKFNSIVQFLISFLNDHQAVAFANLIRVLTQESGSITHHFSSEDISTLKILELQVIVDQLEVKLLDYRRLSNELTDLINLESQICNRDILGLKAINNLKIHLDRIYQMHQNRRDRFTQVLDQSIKIKATHPTNIKHFVENELNYFENAVKLLDDLELHPLLDGLQAYQVIKESDFQRFAKYWREQLCCDGYMTNEDTFQSLRSKVNELENARKTWKKYTQTQVKALKEFIAGTENNLSSLQLSAVVFTPFVLAVLIAPLIYIYKNYAQYYGAMVFLVVAISVIAMIRIQRIIYSKHEKIKKMKEILLICESLSPL